MGGIFSCISAILGNIVPVIFCAVFTLIAIVLLIIDLINKNLLKKIAEIFGTKRALWLCVCLLVGMFLGTGLSALSYNINMYRPFDNGTYACTAKVSEVVDEANTQSVLLKNVVVDDTAYNFKLKLTINGIQVEVGDELSFTAHLFASSLVQNGQIKTNILKNNIQYYGYIDQNSLQITKGKADFIDATKDKSKDILLDSMNEQNAGFAYATLVGDKSLLNDTYYNTFKNAGLAHILAVSGLHVGFLVGAVLFILNLCKLRKKYQFFVVAGVLLLYCTLCGFSPSIFRASVMSLCLMLGMVLGEQNDPLSNLSLAGIIVLIFQPLYLYDVGFLLSFGSVFGILLLSKQISKLLQKIKLPKTLAELIAVTVSATLGTIPPVFAYFGEMSIISVVSNLVVLPLFSIMFVVLLICTTINLIFALPFLMTVAEFFVNIVVNLSAIFAKFQTIKTFSFDTLSGIIYYLLMFLISRFFLIKTKSKGIVAFAVLFAMSPYLTLINMPKVYNNTFVAVSENIPKTLFIATKTNQKILINIGSDDYDVTYTKNVLNQLKVKSLDYLLLFDYDDKFQNNVCEFTNDFEVKNIVAFGKLESSTKVGLATNIKSNKNLSFCEDASYDINNQIDINILYINNIFKASNIMVDGLSILKIENSLTANQITSNSKFFVGYDYCFAKKFNVAMENIISSNFICTNGVATTKNLLLLDDGVLWNYQLS